MTLLALHLGAVRGNLSTQQVAEIGNELRGLPDLVQRILDDSAMDAQLDMLADRFAHDRFFLYLGRHLGLAAQTRFGEQELGFLGTRVGADGFADARALAQHVESRLNRSVTLVGPVSEPVHRIAWCSGGAQGHFEAAIAAGAQVYLTGEISEPQAHLARESGVAYLACGHHATERYGAPALGAHLAAQFGLLHQFIDIDNPA